jgi:hypothetical protein
VVAAVLGGALIAAIVIFLLGRRRQQNAASRRNNDLDSDVDAIVGGRHELGDSGKQTAAITNVAEPHGGLAEGYRGTAGPGTTAAPWTTARGYRPNMSELAGGQGQYRSMDHGPGLVYEMAGDERYELR